jgi:hydrogenase-4 membrane subunit HyfE
MSLSTFELLLISSAIVGIMMLGTTNIRHSLSLYAFHTLMVSVATAWLGYIRGEHTLIYVGIVIGLIKVYFVPTYLGKVIDKIGVLTDRGAFIPPPVTMHIGIAVLGASYLLAQQLPTIGHEVGGSIGATTALSLIGTGILLMLTRRIALNQIVGFLIIENGIYVFSMTQTTGMPMVIEMGILLDVLVGVMIAGLVLFRIKTNFEHIDVSKLTELKD